MLIIDFMKITCLARVKYELKKKADSLWLSLSGACVLVVFSFTGCAARPTVLGTADVVPSVQSPIVIAINDKKTVLFGEVHDNAALHQKRLQWVTEALAAGARPAFAFEQFDREKQSTIDAARAEKSLDADYLIAQASPGKSSWNWAFYRPLIQLALDNDLPIIAANLSRRDAMKVAQSDVVKSGVFSAAELKSLRLDQPIPQKMMAAQSQEIVDGHCNFLPLAAVPAMANAQIARDAVMANVLTPSAQRGVILFAGNGHARRDIGAAAWLPTATKTLTIGMLESAALTSETVTNDSRFDVIEYAAAQPREDPCIALKARFSGVPGPSK
jgi:uncharacterized iron-regulated protein